jgi:RimJ/RimL family protein N-acetyltransferase
MIIEGRRIILRSIEISDLHILWKWRNQPDFKHLCSVRRNDVSFEEFDNELGDDFTKDRHEQFMILKKLGGEVIGTTYSYNLNINDGYVFLTIYIAPEYVARGYGASSFAIFCQYLFSRYHLFKIYTEVYAYNKSLQAMLNGGLTEEGRFKNHRLIDEKRWDLIRLAIYKSQINMIDKIAKA